MTIEAHLQSIDASLQIIATAVSTLAGNGTAPAAAPTKAEKPAKGKAAAANKPAKEKPAKEAPPAEEEGAGEPEAEKLTLNDVRAALTGLQKVVGADAPKALLKKYGATTLSKLKEPDYSKLIADANKQKEEAEAE